MEYDINKLVDCIELQEFNFDEPKKPHRQESVHVFSRSKVIDSLGLTEETREQN